MWCLLTCEDSLADLELFAAALFFFTHTQVCVAADYCSNGNTGKEWKKLRPKLEAKFDKDYKIKEAFTSGPSHAMEIAKEAVRNGAHAVVAVGGDGTFNEVVNGFFDDGKPIEPENGGSSTKTALGLIPLGTGSDFARTFGWTKNANEVVNRLLKGQRQRIDVGYAKAEPENSGRYFVNVADVHLSAKAGSIAAHYKRFGNLCYVIGALQAFMGHRNLDMKIRVDDGEWKEAPQTTALFVGNGKYHGGGMKITPNAHPSTRDFEMVTFENFKWFDFLLKMHMLYNGTHTSLKEVCCERVHKVEIKEKLQPNSETTGKVVVQADGEYVGHLPATFTVIPAAVDLIV
ncbi:hypothetical protein KP509_32G057000 [Ceratopteris richardii]|uniref:DAGKc domain-containing protein n=1 Tax=Ceratopteris richardii TaxID=49495 RepID=A0A8T2QVJ2_CERRI|nr:hypothetical protein KP509_32G057000 [Ceratopteris richardii]KAH7287453.1 hypothetical protein KP509_32G057000 [Ceratopteris richardii]KAH7287455.1 hypothetical protein KP509_32G057000 [Ceratopteris richardii]KAH7287458.1 hypothetical protein KP509_32G057000 [Ceratopteris richardii]KAH7287461.1 hypothetical protein KP509_32G057000 [Ceratopteris richardii]